MQERMIHLKDGRRLAYMEYGQRDGDPVMLFHGTPGSKVWFLEDDEIAISMGLRLIATDRPGFGASDPKRGRTLLDWPDDVAELADQLGIGKFSIIGVSGGGAYAAACAYKIPERLKHVAMVASTFPFEKGRPPKSMMKANRRAFFLAKYMPWLTRLAYTSQTKMIKKQPHKFMELLKKGNQHLCSWDRQYIRTDEQAKEMMNHMGEAFKERVDEGIDEILLLTKPWGFEVSEIRCSVHLWHGEADEMSPFSEIRKMAQAVPHWPTHFVPEAGHFLTSDEGIWREILTTLQQDSGENSEGKRRSDKMSI